MLKFNLTGSVQEELEKIAVEKGWGPKPGYAQIKEEQIKALQKLLNKKTSGREDGPLKVDGIWGFNTAGIYHQVKTQNPELNLETLYGNMDPTNKQVLDAIKILFYKQQEGHGKEILDSAKKAVEELNVPKAEMPAGFIPEKEYKGPGKEIVDSTREAVKGLMSEEKKPAVTNKAPFDAKKYEEEYIKYHMGDTPGLTYEQAKKMFELEKQRKQRTKEQNATDKFPWEREQNPSTKAQKLNFPYEKNVAPWVDPLTEADQSVEPKTQDQTKFVRKPETQSNVAPAKADVKKQQFPKSKAVFDFQKFVQELSPIKIDGVWGQQSNAVWQHICDELGVRLENHSSPIKKPADNVIYSLISKLKGQNADDPGDPGAKNEEAIELAYKENMSAEKALETVASNTISCLVSLADELDSLGEAKVAIAIDNQINFYKKAMDKLYDVTGETGEAFINSAHTDHVTIAPSKDEGGKIENIVEQQKKDIAIVTKDPVGKYASTIIELVKTANTLDEAGLTEEAEKVDMVIAELQKKFPFANEKLASEASNFFGKKYASILNSLKKYYYEFTGFLKKFDDSWRNSHKEDVGEYDKLWNSIKAYSVKLKELINKITIDENNDKLTIELGQILLQLVNAFSVYDRPKLTKFMGPRDSGDFIRIVASLDSFREELLTIIQRKKEMGEEKITYKNDYSQPKDIKGPKNIESFHREHIEFFLKELDGLSKILFKKATEIGIKTKQNPEIFVKLSDSLNSESENIKEELKEVKDKSKLEELYNKTIKLRPIIYNLFHGLENQLEKKGENKYSKYLKITAELDKATIEALKQLGDVFAPKGKDKQKPGTPSSPLAKNRSVGGYNKNLPSDEVEKLQKYLGVKIDGKYGPITHEALKKRLPQLGGNISVPENFNDVRMGNLEQVGDALRQPSSVAPGSKPSTSENVAPESNKKTKMMQWDGGDTAPISKRTTPAQQEDIKDPWGETGEAGGAEGQDQVGGAETNQEQLKKAFLFYLQKYNDLVFDYEQGFLSSWGAFKRQYDINPKQELSNKLNDVRRIYGFLKKYKGAISGSYNVIEMYDNLRSISHLLGMREDEARVSGD